MRAVASREGLFSAGAATSRSVTFGGENGGLRLESGSTLSPVTVAYETWGTLSPARDNAVLVCHALSGSAHAAGYHRDPERERPGWWDFFIGPGKPLDTDRYFVICSNFLGGCYGTTGPASIDGSTGSPYGLSFPPFTVRDMVELQRMLVDRLGIPRLLAVIGGSMGGMQALQWAVSHPDRLAGAIPIAATARMSAQGIAFNEVGRLAITGDPLWRGGRYLPGEGPSAGLALARMIGHITYLSEESMHRKFGRRPADGEEGPRDLQAGFQVERYLRTQGERFVRRFDANTYLYLTRAMDGFDLEAQHCSLEGAFARARCAFLVVSFTTDWLFPAAQSRDMVRAMKRTGRDVAYCNLESGGGHDSFLLPGNRLGDVVRGFLEMLSRERDR